MTVHPTGIPKLDPALGGGLRDHAPLLFRHEGKLVAEPFVYHALQTHWGAGGPVLAAVLERSSVNVQEEAARLGFTFARDGPRFQLLDVRKVYDATEQKGASAHGLERLVEALRAQTASETAVAMPRLDSLAAWFGMERLAAALPGLLEATGRAAFSLWSATDAGLPPGSTALFGSRGAVVRIAAEGDTVRPRPYFAVEQCAWAPPKPERYPYTVARPGGVHLHVPKVLVTGPHDAGKSEFIRAIAQESVSVETAGTTVALDHGRVRRGGVLLEVFGTPGQERFGPVIQQLAAGALGIVLVVDCTRPETFPRAREILLQTHRPGLPLVVAANRLDESGALDAAECRQRLGLADNVPVVGCHANRPASALQVLDVLVEGILGSTPTPSTL